MIGQEIILLGLLKESPKHGYEIKKQIKKILPLFAGIDFKSIYYPLNLLKEKGLIIKHTDKQGKRPERFVYELTSKGKVRFNKLLSESFLNFRRPQFSLDLCLYFLNNINPEIAKRRLRARMLILGKLSLKLSQMVTPLKHKASSPLGRILEHNLRMVQAESNFLSGLIETL